MNFDLFKGIALVLGALGLAKLWQYFFPHLTKVFLLKEKGNEFNLEFYQKMVRETYGKENDNLRADNKALKLELSDFKNKTEKRFEELEKKIDLVTREKDIYKSEHLKTKKGQELVKRTLNQLQLA